MISIHQYIIIEDTSGELSEMGLFVLDLVRTLIIIIHYQLVVNQYLIWYTNKYASANLMIRDIMVQGEYIHESIYP